MKKKRGIVWLELTIHLTEYPYSVRETSGFDGIYGTWGATPENSAKEICLNGHRHWTDPHDPETGVYYSPRVIRKVTWKPVDKVPVL